MEHAVVLGGGLGGMLAAAVLARHAARVTVVENDRYLDGPSPRRGLPQAHQAHMFMRGGVAAMDQVLPGTSDQLFAAGAHRLRMAHDVLSFSAEGWYRRFDHPSYMISCTRHLIDHTVRERVLREKNITVRESTKVVGLVGSASRVTGVRVEEGTGPEELIHADFFVDATGSRSKAPDWLAGIGAPRPREEYLDAGLAYAGRLYEAPEWAADGNPGILIQARPRTGASNGGGGLLPVEGGRWIVPLIGTRGGQPPSHENGFADFARGIRHSVIAQLIEKAEPVSDIRAARGLADRRRYFEELSMPEGFVAIGDSTAVLSPNYATGMSLAAKGALALRNRLKTHRTVTGLAALVQKDVAQALTDPWRAAIANDRWFPRVKTNIKLGKGTLQRGLATRMARAATQNRDIAGAAFEVATLTAPMTRMMTLPLVLTALREAKRPQLSAVEAISQFPEFAGRVTADGPHSEWAGNPRPS